MVRLVPAHEGQASDTHHTKQRRAEHGSPGHPTPCAAGSRCHNDMLVFAGRPGRRARAAMPNLSHDAFHVKTGTRRKPFTGRMRSKRVSMFWLHEISSVLRV